MFRRPRLSRQRAASWQPFRPLLAASLLLLASSGPSWAVGATPGQAMRAAEPAHAALARVSDAAPARGAAPTTGIPMQAGSVGTYASNNYCSGSNVAGGSGENSFGCGIWAITDGYQATAFGNNVAASGDYSVAVGLGVIVSSPQRGVASGAYSSMFGVESNAVGKYSTAVGYRNTADGSSSTAVGNQATAGGDYSTAVGYLDTASGNNSIAAGYQNSASGANAAAVGYKNQVAGTNSSAFGYSNTASGLTSTAVGNANKATQLATNAVGGANTASGVGAQAFGNGNTASGSYASAFGYADQAVGVQSAAFGYKSTASGDYAVALGAEAVAATRRAVAIGNHAAANGVQGFALGSYAQASGNNSVALGGAIDLNADGNITSDETTRAAGGMSMALGTAAYAAADSALAIGGQSSSIAPGSIALGASSKAGYSFTINGQTVYVGYGALALGFGAAAQYDGAIALGWNSVAGATNEFSVGSASAALYRRIANVADPTQAHDAVTLGYLQAHYGPGTASAAGTQPAAPAQPATAAATPAKPVADSARPADSRVPPSGTGSTAQVDAPPRSAHGEAPASIAQVAADDDHAVRSIQARGEEDDTQLTDALASADGYSNTNAQATGTARAVPAQPLAGYVTTDQFEQFQQQVDNRFQVQDERIDKTSAMSTAMVQMAASAAGIDTPNRIGMGVGATHGKSAIAVGYQRAIGRNATFTIGGSATSGESTVGAGVGIGW